MGVPGQLPLGVRVVGLTAGDGQPSHSPAVPTVAVLDAGRQVPALCSAEEHQDDY